MQGCESASERGGQQRVRVEVLVRGGGAARIAVDVDAAAAAELGLPGQARHVEGDVVVVVGLPEAVENPRGRLESGAGDLLVGAGDDPAVAGDVFDAGHGRELVAVSRRAQGGDTHAGDGGGGQGCQFEGALRECHSLTYRVRPPGCGLPARVA